MTEKQFRKILLKIIDKSGEFAVYDKRDWFFKNLEEDEAVIVGEDENETFAIKIIKVD